MTDQELLELAAKAAGLEIMCMFDSGAGPTCHIKSGNQFGKSCWAPLTDDGDAFRLAVKLRLESGFEGDNVVFVDGNFSEFLSEDPAAATRRAIVRAAAFLGGLK